MMVMHRPQQPATTRRKRRLVGAATTAACLALTLWIVRLAVALPSYQAVTQWRSVWVGFDVLELAAVIATGWAVARERHWAPLAAVVTGTLLLSDAWFDVALSWGTPGETTSLGLALSLELPLTLALWALVPRLVPSSPDPKGASCRSLAQGSVAAARSLASKSTSTARSVRALELAGWEDPE
jgi:hypothetical protein